MAAKRYYDPEYSGTLEQIRSEEDRDGAMFPSTKNHIPTEVMIKPWREIKDEGTPRYNDSPEGIDEFIKHEQHKAKLPVHEINEEHHHHHHETGAHSKHSSTPHHKLHAQHGMTEHTNIEEHLNPKKMSHSHKHHKAVID